MEIQKNMCLSVFVIIPGGLFFLKIPEPTMRMPGLFLVEVQFQM